MVVFFFRHLVAIFTAGFIFAFNASCSKGKLLATQNDGSKKINPYSGTDTETPPSDISGAWLVMCRSEATSEGVFLLQCRVNDRNDTKYHNNLDLKIKLPDGTQLDPSQIQIKNNQDYFTFEATIRSPGTVQVEAKSSDGAVTISKQVSMGAVQDLPGLLVGVCGYTNPIPQSTGCDQFKSNFFSKSADKCPAPYIWAPTSSRFQGAVGSGMLEWGSGTCILSPASVDPLLFKEMEKSPADYAVKGGAYGFSFNFTGTCAPATNIFPMKANTCECHTGFQLMEISSHVGGYVNGKSYTCVALATGGKAAALKRDAVTNLNTYNYLQHNTDKTRCLYGSWAPIAAKGDGFDVNWRSVCLSE